MRLTDWTSLAIIILSIEGVVIALVLGVIFYFVNRGVVKAQGALKVYSPIAQDRLRQAALISEQISQQITAPIINVEATNSKARRWVSALRSTLGH